MRARTIVAILFLMTGLYPLRVSAQLLATKDGPIAYGHHHLNVSDVPAQKAFWTALGGVPVKIGGVADAIRFPNVYIMFAAKTPTGGSKGSSADHIGLEVPDLRATMGVLRKAGYAIVTAEELPKGIPAEMQDGIALVGPRKLAIAFVMGPEGTKVELVETPGMSHPVALHHIHLLTQDVDGMKAWYEKVFGAKLPGVSLLYTASPSPVAPTKGRAVDHIGFEVKDLEAFCKRLEAMGITFDRPYGKIPNMGLAVAFFTDTWGTTIELTEGLQDRP